MKMVHDTISIGELQTIADKSFGRLVKAVVDIEKGIMAIDTEMHADGEALLLEQGSKQGDVWGINIHPHATGDDWIEFDSMINVRPSWGNRSRSVDEAVTREKIINIVSKLVQRC